MRSRCTCDRRSEARLAVSGNPGFRFLTANDSALSLRTERSACEVAAQGPRLRCRMRMWQNIGAELNDPATLRNTARTRHGRLGSSTRTTAPACKPNHTHWRYGPTLQAEARDRSPARHKLRGTQKTSHAAARGFAR